MTSRSEKQETGGPAFPVDRQTAHGIAIHEVGAGNEAAYIEAVAKLSHGMTMRDYFAAKAMQGALASHVDDPGTVALYAYKVADSMLEVRDAKA